MFEDLPPAAPMCGVVEFADVALPCLIQASSPRGASIVVSASLDIPSQLTLSDPHRNSQRVVRVAWRRGPHIRVQFVDAPEPPPLRSAR
jgi:hypothetical protein